MPHSPGKWLLIAFRDDEQRHVNKWMILYHFFISETDLQLGIKW